MADESSRTVTSKILAILGSFDGGESTRTLTQIAQHAGITMPTAHRLVGELVDGGALKKDGRGRYRVGRLIWKVAENAAPEVRATGRAHLVELLRLTGETCLFAVRDGDSALIQDRIYSPTHAHRPSKPAPRLPLHQTALGKALLAFDTEPAREAYLAADLDGVPRFTDVERARLAHELEEVRRRKYAVTLEQSQNGPCSVAVPVLLGEDSAVAALGLVMSSSGSELLARHTKALLDVARKMGPETRRWIHFNAVIAALDRESDR
jgi:DNA-binding IclR family transcriptional regulator